MAYIPNRKRAKRTPPSLADQLYPENGPQDASPDDEDEADAPEETGAARTPMQEMADSLYSDGQTADDDTARTPTKVQGKFADVQGNDQGATPEKQDDGAPAGLREPADAQSPVVRDFLQTNPPLYLPHGGVSAAPTMAEQSEREAQAFALFLSKISKTECPLLEKDIGLERGTISKLSQMVKEGKDFKDYGVTPHADDHGYINTEIVGKKSQTYQRLVKLLESDTWRAFTDKLWVYTGAALTGSLNRPLAMREKERSEWVLRGMIDTYDKLCKK